jgi:hypothetical protein
MWHPAQYENFEVRWDREPEWIHPPYIPRVGVVIFFIPPLPGGGGGYTLLPQSVLPYVQDIFRRIFLSNYQWQKSDIWSQASYRYAILWVAFLDPSDSYFLFADLVGFYAHAHFSSHFSQELLMTQIWYLVTSFISVPHIVGSVFGPIRFLLPVCRFCWFLYTFNIHLYMLIFRRIFLSNYWWQESDIWSQASYRYPISWEAFLDPSDSYFLFAEERGYHKWALAHSSSCSSHFSQQLLMAEIFISSQSSYWCAILWDVFLDLSDS